MNTIYLAGGFRSGWQNKVKESCPSLEFLDPAQKEKGKNLSLPEYGTWDFHAIKKSDIFFGYMERTNPSGFGLAVEIGYAKGIGKTAILILEPNHETQEDRYLQFLKKAADVTFENINDAIEYLKSF